MDELKLKKELVRPPSDVAHNFLQTAKRLTKQSISLTKLMDSLRNMVTDLDARESASSLALLLLTYRTEVLKQERKTKKIQQDPEAKIKLGAYLEKVMHLIDLFVS